MISLPEIPWTTIVKWFLGAVGTVTLPTLVGWYFLGKGQSLQNRQQLAAERSDEAKRLLELTTVLSDEVAKAKDQVARYTAEIELLRAARWSIDEVLLQLHSGAIAARTMVHDLQRQLGIPETQFPPLPQPSWTYAGNGSSSVPPGRS